jgi:hypothetical protein
LLNTTVFGLRRAQDLLAAETQVVMYKLFRLVSFLRSVAEQHLLVPRLDASAVRKSPRPARAVADSDTWANASLARRAARDA